MLRATQQGLHRNCLSTTAYYVLRPEIGLRQCISSEGTASNSERHLFQNILNKWVLMLQVADSRTTLDPH